MENIMKKLIYVGVIIVVALVSFGLSAVINNPDLLVEELPTVASLQEMQYGQSVQPTSTPTVNCNNLAIVNFDFSENPITLFEEPYNETEFQFSYSSKGMVWQPFLWANGAGAEDENYYIRFNAYESNVKDVWVNLNSFQGSEWHLCMLYLIGQGQGGGAEAQSIVGIGESTPTREVIIVEGQPTQAPLYVTATPQQVIVVTATQTGNKGYIPPEQCSGGIQMHAGQTANAPAGSIVSGDVTINGNPIYDESVTSQGEYYVVGQTSVTVYSQWHGAYIDVCNSEQVVIASMLSGNNNCGSSSGCDSIGRWYGLPPVLSATYTD